MFIVVRYGIGRYAGEAQEYGRDHTGTIAAACTMEKDSSLCPGEVTEYLAELLRIEAEVVCIGTRVVKPRHHTPS